jgi:hypothetical protein
MLNHHSNLVPIFQTFHKMIQTQFSRTIKIFRSDNAQEYTDKYFLSVLDTNGTLPHRSCQYTSQQVGCAQHKLRHILDIVRTLLISTSISKRFWGEAALTAVYTINRLPSPTTHKKSPFELLYDKLPDYSSLRVFCCAYFVSLPPMNEINSNLGLSCVVFSAMVSLKRVFAAMIPNLFAFVSPIMWNSGNIRLSLVVNIFPSSLPPCISFLLIL